MPVSCFFPCFIQHILCRVSTFEIDYNQYFGNVTYQLCSLLCCVLSYVLPPEKWPSPKTRSAAPNRRQTDKPVYISRRCKRTCLFAVTGLPQVIYSGSGWMKFINPLNPSGFYITHLPTLLTFGPHYAFRLHHEPNIFSVEAICPLWGNSWGSSVNSYSFYVIFLVSGLTFRNLLSRESFEKLIVVWLVWIFPGSYVTRGPGSVVVITTSYGLDGPGIDCR